MAKLSGSQQVEEYLQKLEHPLKNEIEEVRRIILSIDKELSEHVKWNAPSFCFHNDDRVTFNLHGNGFFRLVLHRGAKAKESVNLKPHFEDVQGLMEWAANDRASIKFSDIRDVEAKSELLKEVVRRWVDVT
ncbi:uncharacterized protein YdhG (YjbR/CyaY superfamily) [Paenibacillus phyllosphaerae]|uniref:Uncharacterized protein YdhG (YjbR/CyaY superfamily) n=1 Tax=Paenibacillus phyllosphaerae TaxID=274593 RepID=A0A7W5FQM8_9BACL|nr:DUF1801 domain-containing protein [Paenibacillus phyllosphaerae]MBB3113397.1 uncharacterized protein YdhG (YjbR/CyaY superfamily) [Paenibacillus phyllosphaerae]